MKESELKEGMAVQHSQTGERLTYLRMDNPFAVCLCIDGEETMVHPSHLEPDGSHK